MMQERLLGRNPRARPSGALCEVGTGLGLLSSWRAAGTLEPQRLGSWLCSPHAVLVACPGDGTTALTEYDIYLFLRHVQLMSNDSLQTRDTGVSPPAWSTR